MNTPKPQDLETASVDSARAVTRADRQYTLKNSGLLQTSEERRVQYEARKALLALKPQDVIRVYWIGNRAFPSILESAETKRREQQQPMNTPLQLEQDGATLPVNQINHREYVLNGYRYFFGWDSTADKSGTVQGWILYKTTKEIRQ